jgi:hypothetical protein
MVNNSAHWYGILMQCTTAPFFQTTRANVGTEVVIIHDYMINDVCRPIIDDR